MTNIKSKTECCIFYELTKHKTSCNHYICIQCSEQYSNCECPMCRQPRKDICYLCYELTLTCVCYVKYLFEPDNKAAVNMLVKYMSNKYGFNTPYLPIVVSNYVNKYQLDNQKLKIKTNDI